MYYCKNIKKLISFFSFSYNYLYVRHYKKHTIYSVCGVRGRTNRIVGGNILPAHEYPWLVGLSRQGKIYCGASLISRNHVLTAAHCVNGIEANEIRVCLYFIYKNIILKIYFIFVALYIYLIIIKYNHYFII